MSTEVEKIIQERGNSYGSYRENAALVCDIMSILRRTHDGAYQRLLPYEQDALHMKVHKIARIIGSASVGNPASAREDSWNDSAGYSSLVVREIKKEGVPF